MDGEIAAIPTSAFPALRGDASANVEPTLSRAEQSNTAIIYGDRFIFKLFRRPEVGINPDVEIGRYLTERKFANVAALGGTLEYRSNGEVRNIGILSSFVPDAKNAWAHTLDALGRYYERVLLFIAEDRALHLSPKSPLELSEEEPSVQVVGAIGTFLESARILGIRTAELHLALAAGEEKDFIPEPFTPHYQRSLYQSMRNLVMENFQLLRQQEKNLPPALKEDAARVLALQDDIIDLYRNVYETRIDALRIRCHGDYHLGQVLYTGKDFIILDFEGEPARALSTRRLKRSPVSNVAGMLRSFHYAAFTALNQQLDRGLVSQENHSRVSGWASYWYQWVSASYLRAYLKTLGSAKLLPSDPEELKILFDAYLVDKAVYEIGYELNNRPAWLRIPFDGILQLVRPDAPEPSLTLDDSLKGQN